MKKCRACQKEIDQKAKKCPHCQTDLRNWFVRHKITTAIILIFLITGAFSGSSDKSSSSTESSIKNEGAKVEPTQGSGEYEIKANVRYSADAFLIENEEPVALSLCRLEMNSPGLFKEGYKFNLSGIAANDSAIVPFNEFTKSDGTRFNPYSTKPQSLSMFCDGVGGKKGWNYFGIN